MTMAYPNSVYFHDVPTHLQTDQFGPLVAATMTFLVSTHSKFVMIRIQAEEPPELYVRPLESAGTVL